MLTWIDILIIVIIGICIILGAYKGLVKSVFSLVTIVLSFLVAKMFTPVLSSWLINNTNIENTIHNFFKVKDTLPSVPSGVSDASNSVSVWFDSLNLGEVPNSVINFFQNLWNGGVQAAGNANATVADITTASIVSFISFIGLLIFAFVVISLLVEVLTLVTKLPVIGTFNTIGGAVFGFLKGLILNLVIISILFVIAIFLKDSPLNIALRDSLFASYFYIGYILF